MATRTYKLYSEMTLAEQAAIDACEDRREAYKAAMNRDSSVEGLRRQYAMWRDRTVEAGFQGDFADACVASVGQPPMTPEGWVLAARQVYFTFDADTNEGEARCS